MAKRGLAGDDEMEAGMPAMQGSAIRPKTARGEGGAPANHVSEQSEKRRGSGSEDAARRGSEGGRDADLQVPDAGDGREYMEDDSDILDVGANIGLFSLFCNLNLPQPPQPPALHGPHRGAAAGDAAQAGKGEGEVAQDGKGEAGRSAGGVPAGRARNRVFAFEPVPAIYQVLERNLKDLPEMHPRPYGLAAVPSSSET
ncbi:hypothetical protein T484DRAFT_1788875 [Baffinella frigidus]|nr:hypothetical protein T484DRAFT_1788875 [Cryptophyta sp. CCMP2293]